MQYSAVQHSSVLVPFLYCICLCYLPSLKFYQRGVPQSDEGRLVQYSAIQYSTATCLKCNTPQYSSVTWVQVKRLAIQHWTNTTVTEPAKQRRPRGAVQDGAETVPTRYQTTTNDEAYESFRESQSAEVGRIMAKHSLSLVEMYSKRKESPDKDYRLKHPSQVLPSKFPSQSWYIEQRPPEVKLLHDHTTGLCKVLDN